MNTIASRVTAEKSIRRCENILHAGAKSARNVLTNWIPNQAPKARPDLLLQPGISTSAIASCETKLQFI